MPDYSGNGRASLPGASIGSQMAGRPSLRIGAHGKITRVHLGGGVWLARCRYRDSDGVTRKVQRLGPPGIYDQYGKLAENAPSNPSLSDAHHWAMTPSVSKLQ
jgi:hypothetical protein